MANKKNRRKLIKNSKNVRSKRNNSITLVLCLSFVLILSSGSLVFYQLIKQKDETQAAKLATQTGNSNNVQGLSTEDLSTLENNDLGYTVQFPADFDAVNNQNAAEFMPKNGPGKVILQVKNGHAQVSINSDKVDPSQSSILSDAAQKIQTTFQLEPQIPIDKKELKQRFADIKFDPKKY